MRLMRFLVISSLIVTCLCCTGCVRRTITITSDPPGALVWLNDREVGRTPVEVDFLFYGEYDVRLEREGYEPRMTSGTALPPLWDSIPLDLLAEAMPFELHSRVRWHYDLAVDDADSTAVVERANELRARVSSEEDVDAVP